MIDTDLLALCQKNIYDTDKFSTNNDIVKWVEVKHSYVEAAYGKAFERIRNAKNVLEIGTYTGGSHLLWRDYFPEATVVGIDVKLCDELLNQDRIIQVVGDAYCKEAVSMFQDNYFDLIIDDGPHTLDSMKYAIEHYLCKLKDDGIFCIEDIVEFSWVYGLSRLVPDEYQNHLKIYDLRERDGKGDSILLVIDKGVTNG